MTRPIDVAAVRRETPGCTMLAHFNNAGASLPPRIVTATVVEHLLHESQAGGYEAADAARGRIEAVYDLVARLLNCARDEVALVENATRAWDMAFYALAFRPGDRILAGVAEYASNAIALLQVAQRTGARVEVVPDDAHGQIDLAALERMADASVKLIALTHVPTNGGLVNPAAEVGRIARARGIPFLLDACQSAGQLALDVEALGCDLLAATGRKYLRGPRGTGFLYVRRALIGRLEPPFLDLHAARWTAPDRYEIRADARRFETWECDVAARLGLGAALDYAFGLGLDAIEARVTALGEALRARLADVPGVRVADKGVRRCGIVTFAHPRLPPDEVKAKLRPHAITVNVTRRPSTLWDMQARGLDALVRASVHYYNTEDEIDRLCRMLAELR